jgi:hypothetical protein
MERTLVLTTPHVPVRRHIPGAVEIAGDLYGALGGTRGTVLARAGLFLASKLGRNVLDRAAVTRALAPLHDQSRPLPVRMPKTDEQVSAFICSTLKTNPNIGHTTLLRQFRKEGYACEHGRFRKLHAAAKKAR